MSGSRERFDDARHGVALPTTHTPKLLLTACIPVGISWEAEKRVLSWTHDQTVLPISRMDRIAGSLDDLLMTKRYVFAGAMLVFQALGCSVFTEPAPERYTASLKVDNTLRPVTNAANGSGSALFSRRSRVLDFSINVSGLSANATAAHLHGPAVSGAGEIIFSFSIVPGMTSARIAGGILSNPALPGVSVDSLRALMRNGNAYVDVHTELNPAGEIIGQIGPESPSESSQTREP